MFNLARHLNNKLNIGSHLTKNIFPDSSKEWSGNSSEYLCLLHVHEGSILSNNHF